MEDFWNSSKMLIVFAKTENKGKILYPRKTHSVYGIWIFKSPKRVLVSYIALFDWISTRPPVWSKKGIIWDLEKIHKSISIATSNFCLDWTFQWDVPYILEAQVAVNLRRSVNSKKILFLALAYIILAWAPFIPDEHLIFFYSMACRFHTFWAGRMCT